MHSNEVKWVDNRNIELMNSEYLWQSSSPVLPHMHRWHSKVLYSCGHSIRYSRSLKTKSTQENISFYRPPHLNAKLFSLFRILMWQGLNKILHLNISAA